MAFFKQSTLHTEDWQDEVRKAIEGGLFRERYSVLVLVTNDSTGTRTGIANKCAALFKKYSLIEEAQCDRHWLLEYLSSGGERQLCERVVSGIKAGKKLQVITDLHQYFYNEQRAAYVLNTIKLNLTEYRTEVPVVCLVKEEAFRWMYSTIGAASVLYLTDGISVQYEAPVKKDEAAGNGREDSRRISSQMAYGSPEHTPSRQVKEESRSDRTASVQSRPWYERQPDLLNFEMERVMKGCSGFTDEKLYYMQDRRYAYWKFAYLYRDIKCTVLALYNVDFPNAGPDNITLVPMEPAFEDFRKLHGNLLDYRFDKELNWNVISIRVRREELRQGQGYAETAWKKLLSELSNNDSKERRSSSGFFPESFFSFFN